MCDAAYIINSSVPAHSLCRRWVAGFFAAIFFLLPGHNNGFCAEKSKEMVSTFLKKGPVEKQQTFVETYKNGPAGFEQFAAIVAENYSKNRSIVARLAGDTTTTGRTLYAELLRRCSRGLEVPSWDRAKRELDEMPANEVGERAIHLMADPDLFIRAPAEWAIDIRIGMLNSGRTKIWPMSGDGKTHRRGGGWIEKSGRDHRLW